MESVREARKIAGKIKVAQFNIIWNMYYFVDDS